MDTLNLKELQLTQDELETLTKLHFSQAWINFSFRPSSLKSFRAFLDLAITEVILLMITSIFCIPIVLLVLRNTSWLLINNQDAIAFFTVGFGTALIVFLGMNGLFWWRSHRYRSLDRILLDVDRYNDIIQSIQIFQELESHHASRQSLEQQSQLLQALTITRENLVCAIMTDRILRKNQRFLSRRQELLENIETNLITLQAVQLPAEASDYQQFLNDALQIALSVRQELDYPKN